MLLCDDRIKASGQVASFSFSLFVLFWARWNHCSYTFHMSQEPFVPEVVADIPPSVGPRTRLDTGLGCILCTLRQS